MLNIVISLGETKRFPSEMKTIGFVSDISVTHIKEKWFLNPSPQKKTPVSFPKRCGCCCSERVLRKLTFIKDFERVLCYLCNLLRILCNFAESKGFAKKVTRHHLRFVQLSTYTSSYLYFLAFDFKLFYQDRKCKHTEFCSRACPGAPTSRSPATSRSPV